MKSKIKSLSRNEQRTIIFFEKDDQIPDIIEKAFKKINSDFKLSEYKKIKKNADNYWELNKNNGDINFTLIVKKDFVRLKLKGSLEFIEEYLRILEKYTEFSELLPKVKAKLQRRKFKFI